MNDPKGGSMTFTYREFRDGVETGKQARDVEEEKGLMCTCENSNTTSVCENVVCKPFDS